MNEQKFVITGKPEAKEYRAILTVSSHRPTLTILVCIMMAAYAALGFFSEKFKELTIFVAVVCVLYFTLPYFYGWTAIKNIKTINGGTLPDSRTEFSDKIYYECGITKQELPYERINRIYMKKKYIIFRMEKRVFICIPKGAFSEEELNKFIPFLENKTHIKAGK